MAFPSTSGSVPLTLEAAWQQARSVAASVKATANNILALIAAGPVSSIQLVGLPGYMNQQNTILTQCGAVSGIAAYAQAQVGNAGLNVPAAFSAMQTAMTNVSNWVTTNFPKDGSNNLLYQQYNGGGNFAYLSFTQAQLAGLVTVLNALVATID